MNNKKLYQETFGQIHSSKMIRFDDFECKQERRRLPQKMIIIAAVISLVTAASAAAIAVRWFELRDLELTNEITVQQPDGTEVTEQVATGTISLQGFGEMPEKLAVEEWHRFLGSYDYYSVLETLGNAPTGFEEQYGYYQVYTQEMADELEEIAAKYGLRLHTDMIDDIYTDQALCDQVGGNFLGKNHAYSTYMYEDGTFHFDGVSNLAGYGSLNYQFQRCVRGSLTDVILNIGDVEAYTEWSYTAKKGIVVTLAIAEHKALVIADLPDSFVTINVLAGTETQLTAADLERFVDSFDFSVLTPARPADPSLPRPTLDEVLGTPSAEEFLQATGMTEMDAQSFFAEFSALLESGEREAVVRLLRYPAVVTVQGELSCVTTPEEMLAFYDDLFTGDLWESIIINQYTRERADLSADHGGVVAAGGAITFAAQGDDILIVAIENAGGNSFRYEIENK